MIELKVAMKEGELLGVMEANHVSELKRAGVPMRGGTLFKGVEVGELTLLDTEGERTYTWRSKVLKHSKNPLKRRFRIKHASTLGEVWYEVQEWNWYLPVWDTWTHVVYLGKRGVVRNIKYDSLYVAKEAVRFYTRNEKPIQVIVDHL